MTFLEGPRPRILAHRGLATEAPENTLAAFHAAVAVGATHVESDVRVSADGVAMLVHDATLERVSQDATRIEETSSEALRTLDLGGGHGVPTLAECLAALPETRWNLDLKVPEAVEPAARAILEADAVGRVLVTSFDDATRARAVAALPGVATSASRGVMARALVAVRLRRRAALARILDGIAAVQVPERLGRIRIVDVASVEAFHAAGVEVHVWTVNEPFHMRRLVSLGVDGVVTDRADLAVTTLR
ncbi:glycerophosphodiester phosphodiesterase family protein [Agrococcus jejuensis]|uniref:Glycerophosphoryl diester phosphodiesterase n=1 Tax=Agrococcus jejuensis TaxID=399736 RepID=A0A1G8H5S1_9MICO|nr:glycerophosphodiester phosphodiesterase family protein [Agrococcus jejuensis]SDI01988.1 glycerophosphoryl diester phosphodiesterase [Agrococcus jejuensis]